jgi:hypothetical protein
MRVIFIGAILSLSLCPRSRAQDFPFQPFNLFPEAAVVLTTDTILTGALKLYPSKDVIYVTCANDSTYTLTAQLVQGFAVKDVSLTQQRTRNTHVALERVFRTFPLSTGKNPRLVTWGFYEQLSQGPGPVLLLRRETESPRYVVMPGNPVGVGGFPTTPASPLSISMQPGFTKAAIYLRTTTGAVVRLRKPKHILRYLPHQAQLLRAYVRQNGLRYANMRELAFLVNYANTLLKKP